MDMKDKRLIALKAYDVEVKECIGKLPSCSDVQNLIVSFLEEYVVYEKPNTLQLDRNEFESFEKLNGMNNNGDDCYACIVGECEKHVLEMIYPDNEVFWGIIECHNCGSSLCKMHSVD